MKTTWLAIAIASIPGFAMAHEGHGLAGDGNTVQHYLFEPLHLPALLVACAAIIWVAAQLCKRSRRVDRISR